MSADACASLVDVAYLYSQLPLSSNRNDRPVHSLLLLLDAAVLLLDAAVAVASAIDDNILEDLQALPVDDQNKIKSRLGKIAEKTTQPPPKNSMDEADLKTQVAILIARHSANVRPGQSLAPAACEVLELVAGWLDSNKGLPDSATSKEAGGWDLAANVLYSEAHR
jgi:hypothetical protein